MTLRSGISPRRRRRRTLPLRWRVAVAFAFASLLVTGVLALVTWSLASDYMLDQRQQSALGQFSANTRLITSYLQRHPSVEPNEAPLLLLEYDQDDSVALRAGGRWITDGPMTDPATLSTLSDLLVNPAANVSPSPTRRIVDGRPVLATAVPLPQSGALYLELSALGDLQQTLQFVKSVLLAGVGASFVLGLLLGRWAGHQALRPLSELTSTAERVAGGDLRARLPEQTDADLASLATTFNRTAAALEQRVARDARFAGDVSHELRSPLTTMVNATAVLNRRVHELSPTSRQALRLLTADVERFHQMVIDLLEISRDHSTRDDDLEPCDLTELVRHTLAARHDTVPLHADGPHPLVLADRRRLDRVITNLVDNAHRHAGGAVRVAVLSRDGRARLEIDDAGPGIPVELRRQVFERFTRGNRHGDRGQAIGSGLGLALVNQHVLGHGGAVWIEDRPGGGARFVVELPLLVTD